MQGAFYISRVLKAALPASVMVAAIPLLASAADMPWLDQIHAKTSYHQRLAQFEDRAQAYTPYFTQLERARMALGKGDEQGTTAAMNRFIEMLLAREGKIPGWSKQELFIFSLKVTPAHYYDAARYALLVPTEEFDYSRGTPLWLGDGAYILDDVWASRGAR